MGSTNAGTSAITPRGAASRSRLLAAARTELVQNDGHLEVDAVAVRARASVGLIYRHFGSRAGLVTGVVDDFYQRLVEEVVEHVLAAEQPIGTKLRRLSDGFVAFHYSDPFARVALLGLHLNEEVVVHDNARIADLVGSFAGLIRAGQRAGELPNDHDARLLGAMIVGGARQVLADAVAQDIRPSERKVAAALWKMVAGLAGVAGFDGR